MSACVPNLEPKDMEACWLGEKNKKRGVLNFKCVSERQTVNCQEPFQIPFGTEATD